MAVSTLLCYKINKIKINNDSNDIVTSPTQQKFIIPVGVLEVVVWTYYQESKPIRKAFWNDYWNLHGGTRPSQHMSPSSNVGIAGVRNRVEIRCSELSGRIVWPRILILAIKCLQACYFLSSCKNRWNRDWLGCLKRHLRNERLSRPKYESVWRVDQVLTMFWEDGGSASLSLQDLRIKTAMLFGSNISL